MTGPPHDGPWTRTRLAEGRSRTAGPRRLPCARTARGTGAVTRRARAAPPRRAPCAEDTNLGTRIELSARPSPKQTRGPGSTRAPERKRRARPSAVRRRLAEKPPRWTVSGIRARRKRSENCRRGRRAAARVAESDEAHSSQRGLNCTGSCASFCAIDVHQAQQLSLP